MLPAGFASMTVRKKDCRVNSGKSFVSNPWFNIGAWMEIKFDFFQQRTMQRGDVAVAGKEFSGCAG